jgi:hypothetical protein
MDKRPRSITVISWIFILLGAISFVASLLPYIDADSGQRLAELRSHWMVHLARIAAVVSGVFMLRGFNWARWLLVVWMAFHLIISVLHSILQLLFHGVIFALILYFIFRPVASIYFRDTNRYSPTEST